MTANQSSAPPRSIGETGLRVGYPDPLWVQAADALREQLTADGMRPGSRLPPERELCQSLGISRVTLRKALQALVDDGVLTPSHGRGWFVAGAAEDRNEWPNSLESFSETASRMGLVASSRVLRSEVSPASIDEAEQLAIAPGTPLFRLGRVRMLNEVAIAVDLSLVPASLLPDPSRYDFREHSLYEALAAAGHQLANAETTIEAREASAEIAEHLDVVAGSPTLVMHQLVSGRTERPVLASTIQYAGDRYRLRTYFARHNRTELP